MWNVLCALAKNQDYIFYSPFNKKYTLAFKKYLSKCSCAHTRTHTWHAHTPTEIKQPPKLDTTKYLKYPHCNLSIRIRNSQWAGEWALIYHCHYETGNTQLRVDVSKCTALIMLFPLLGNPFFRSPCPSLHMNIFPILRLPSNGPLYAFSIHLSQKEKKKGFSLSLKCFLILAFLTFLACRTFCYTEVISL